jgi:hypothetical protein
MLQNANTSAEKNIRQVINGKTPGTNPKPGEVIDWYALKSDVLTRAIEIAQFGMSIDKLNLSYRGQKLLDGAAKDAIDSLKDYENTVGNSELSDTERMNAHRKAMQLTKDCLVERAASIQKEALAAVEGYLQADGQTDSCSEVMKALDDLLFERGIKHSDRSDFQELIAALTSLLFVPEVGARFYSMTEFKPEDVAKYMGRLTQFFRALGKDPVEADIDRHSLKEVPSRYSYRDLSWIKWNYEKLAAKSRASFQVDEEFDNRD